MTSANGEPTIKTYSGITLNFMEPAPMMIEIPDIAHGLSQVCRFAAQSSEFYSVAQHSVLVSRLVPKKFARWGLMHDAAEAYIGDMARPLKRCLPEYKKIEVGIMRVIAFRFDLEWPEPKEVKNADIYALALEGMRFMKGREDEYGIATTQVAKLAGMATNALYSMTPAEGKRLFMDRFRELFGP